MTINSRDKGAKAEREYRNLLRTIGCTDARRGCQHSGGPDSPDVECGIPGTHVEVKRTERLRIYEAMQQAVRDSGLAEVPYVAHRRNHGIWLVTMRHRDLMRMARCIAAIEDKPIYPIGEGDG